jgi:hypothetical protein
MGDLVAARKAGVLFIQISVAVWEKLREKVALVNAERVKMGLAPISLDAYAEICIDEALKAIPIIGGKKGKADQARPSIRQLADGDAEGENAK